MSKRVLFLTSRYLPYADANGLCTLHLCEYLRECGYIVDIVAERHDDEPRVENVNGIDIYRYDLCMYSSGRNRIEKIHIRCIKVLFITMWRVVRMIWLAISALVWPNTELIQNYRLYIEVDRIHKLRHYDLVVSVARPYYNIYAMQLFKRKHPNVVWGVWLCDNIVVPGALTQVNKYIKLIERDHITTKISQMCDFMMVPPYAFNDFGNVGHNECSNIYRVGFPFIRNKNDVVQFDSSTIDNNKVIFTYAGRLVKQYRNPMLLLRYLSECKVEGKCIELHIYGRGDCFELIDQFQKNNGLKVYIHGQVSKEVVDRALYSSHIVVNIENDIDSLVPSKIFDLMTYHKPIVNMQSKISSVQTVFLDQYPACISIGKGGYSASDVRTLESFVSFALNCHFEVGDLEQQFPEHTPQYIARILIEQVNRNAKD